MDQPATETPARVAELRSLIGSWRRGRATTRLAEAVSDAYIGLFAVVMLGSMLVNVVLTVRAEAGSACLSEGCVAARSLLPWTAAATALAGVLGVARLLGPVHGSPAATAWLFTAPVPRAGWLRRRLVVLALLGAGIVLAVGLPVAAVAGLSPAATAAFAAACAAAGAGSVGLAARSQARGDRLAAVALWALVAAVWVALVGLVLGWWGPVPGELSAPVAVVLVLVAVPVVLLVPAWRGLASLHRRQLSPGGALSASLSGAMASLDLTLALDVVVAHGWRRRGWVRPVRGGPVGWAALVARDVVRLRRRPVPAVLLLLACVVPWAAAQAGAGRVAALVVVLTAFLALVPWLFGLRVLLRGRSLLRLLPFTDTAARSASLVVPGAGALVLGLAAWAPLATALDLPASHALAVSLAAALGGLAAAVWWIAGPSVDWNRPAVSTPAGAVQPGLVASLLRGLDVCLLASAPLLLAPRPVGAAVSALLSVLVLGGVLARRQG